MEAFFLSKNASFSGWGRRPSLHPAWTDERREDPAAKSRQLARERWNEEIDKLTKRQQRFEAKRSEKKKKKTGRKLYARG